MYPTGGAHCVAEQPLPIVRSKVFVSTMEAMARQALMGGCYAALLAQAVGHRGPLQVMRPEPGEDVCRRVSARGARSIAPSAGTT